MKDIWELICRGTRYPSFLKIRLTDPITRRPGHLYLIDLLDPVLTSSGQIDYYKAHYLFHNLRK